MGRWWHAVADHVNFDSHLVYITQARDGAIRFLDQGLLRKSAIDTGRMFVATSTSQMSSFDRSRSAGSAYVGSNPTPATE